MFSPIRSRARRALPSLLAAGLLALASPASAQLVVGEFAEVPADEADLVPGTWYAWFITGTGAATTTDLTGVGGDLETNQPLPNGAALLTTEFDNADRSNVGVYDLLGATVGDVFPTLEMGYDFLKASNPGQNANAAASLKLEIYNEACHDPDSGVDCYGTLIYEPYVNGFGNEPLQDAWMRADVTPDSGGFWWSGGFGQPSSFAGPPYRTLSEWLGLMNADFQDATVVTVQVGVGSYNQGMRAYFDNVTISHGFGGGLDVAYDFESITAVEIDVRPNNDQNQVNTNAKQLVPIAILGSEDFDPVAEVDIDTVRVRGAAPIGTKFDGADVNGDGYADFTLYFRARSLTKPSESECSDAEAKLELSGATNTGSVFAGSDSVTWQGPDCP